MDKKISIKVWTTIAIVAVIIVILAIWIVLAPPVQPPTKIETTIPNTPTDSAQGQIQNQNQSPASVGDDKQKTCLDSGGKVSAALCCGQTQDFPNNCAIGACGCAPTSSHQIKTCNCEEEKCFDGNSCVSK